VLAPAIASLLFTLAGTGTAATAPDAGLAARADLLPNASVAPLPDGTFLIGDGSFVRHVDTRGMQRAIAGNGSEGTSGDGGPATAARLSVSGLAAQPGGGYLIADGDDRRVRMVDANGVISTVAGGGGSRADGVPATQARLGRPNVVAVVPGGGFLIGDDAGVVRRVGPDGLIRTIAGNGENESPIPKLTGQPATSVSISVSDLAVEADGSVLIADGYASRVDRVSPSGAIGIAAADVSAYGVGALPDGGFVVADNGFNSSEGAEGRIWRYAPDGSRTLLAGSGRSVSTAPTGLEHRGDGGSALDADLGFMRDVRPTADGGVLFTEGTDSLFSDRVGALVRYVAPAQPGILAASIVRDRDRVFTPGRPSRISVTTTLPATLTVAGTTTAVPAGTTRVPLPALSARPHTIEVTATDASGRQAVDRARVFPRGYLPDETARDVAAGTAFSALGPVTIVGDGVLSCRRLGARRVDCAMASEGRHCRVTTAISFAAGRVRWGTYGCGYESHPRYRRHPRPLRRGDWSCEVVGASCPAALFGKLKDAAIVPSS
jgi:hypothetical protein